MERSLVEVSSSESDKGFENGMRGTCSRGEHGNDSSRVLQGERRNHNWVIGFRISNRESLTKGEWPITTSG